MDEYVKNLEFKYRPTNKRVYTYAEIFPTITPPINPISYPTPKYEEKPQPIAKEIVQRPVKKTEETQVNLRELKTLQNPKQYDPSLHYDTPKGELDIPLYTALKLTLPQQIPKYVEEAQRYNYVVDPDLTTEDNSVLVNDKNKMVVFGVRGTNPESTEDVMTDVSLLYKNVKSLNRYKYAKEFLDKTRRKYQGYKINLIGWSLGGIIASELGETTDNIYTYNRPFFEANIKPNEKSFSVEGDFLLTTLPHLRGTNKGKNYNPVIIPRTYYDKARDFYQIEKLKVNPDFESKPIEIPEEYKNEYLPLYKNLLYNVLPYGATVYSTYKLYKNLKSQSDSTPDEEFPDLPIIKTFLAPKNKPSEKPRFFVSSRDTTSPIKSAIPMRRRPKVFKNLNEVGGGGVVANTAKAIKNANVEGIQALMNPSSIAWTTAGIFYPQIQKLMEIKLNKHLKKLENIHAVENLPLSIRIEK
jgi:hypothetical protein